MSMSISPTLLPEVILEPDGGRYELKYVLTKEARAQVIALAEPHVRADPYGVPLPEVNGRGYHTHSIYFDTPFFDDYTERMCQKQVRVRMRIRTYGYADERAPVFFEDKRKFETWVLKQRLRVCNSDQWLNTDSDKPWVYWAGQAQGGGVYMASHFLQRVEGEGRTPVSVVHYTRESFVARKPSEGEVRLTFDHHLCSTTRPGPKDFFAPPDVDLIPKNMVVMEMKFNGTKPRWMRDICAIMRLSAEPVSKFSLSVVLGLRSDRLREVRRNTPRAVLISRGIL